MSVQKLPSGRWRAQVFDKKQGKNVSVTKVLDDATLRSLGANDKGTFRTRTEAKQARAEARRRLETAGVSQTTLAEFWERWTTDPLFARPKESTNIHNRERTKAFVDRYGSMPLPFIGDSVVAEWLAGGKRNSTVPALRAMFNDACSAKAGRLINVNPFAGLGLSKGPGNKHRQPPTVEQMQQLVNAAWQLTPPSFASYLETGCLTAARPSELDAMQWDWIRWEDGEIDLREQWNAKTRMFTPPKYGPYTVAMVGRAREVLLGCREFSSGRFVFETLRGTHYTPSARTHHWNRVRAAAGLGDMTLYLATRHYFGWHAVNVLGLDVALVAEQLGHKDGGKLVEQLYGHPDKARRRRLIREAHDSVEPARVTKLRVVDGGAS